MSFLFFSSREKKKLHYLLPRACTLSRFLFATLFVRVIKDGMNDGKNKREFQVYVCDLLLHSFSSFFPQASRHQQRLYSGPKIVHLQNDPTTSISQRVAKWKWERVHMRGERRKEERKNLKAAAGRPALSDRRRRPLIDDGGL